MTDVDYRKNPIIGIDFDGVLAQYDGWKGEFVLGDPMPGAKEALESLKKEGYLILVWTTRGNSPHLREWFEKHQIPYDFINSAPVCKHQNPGKPPCIAWIDDRGIRFEGDWKATLSYFRELVAKEKERSNGGYGVWPEEEKHDSLPE